MFRRVAAHVFLGPPGYGIRQISAFPLENRGNGGHISCMARPSTRIKNTDSKGRITLGESYANRTMLVEKHGDGVFQRFTRVIPERETWLYDNEKAPASVQRGVQQVCARSSKMIVLHV